jgi:threonine aldolase
MARARTVHQSAPAVVSVTQPTELGTVYPLAELRAIVATARRWGLRTHLDGARLASAASALGVSLGATSTDLGFDVVCLGGTKNGLAFGEVVLTADPALAALADRARKGLAQMGSKQRFLSAQLVELYGSPLWRTLAATANGRARRLAAGLRAVPGVQIVYPVEANAVFVAAPPAVEAMLGERYAAQTFTVPRRAVRLMCGWDTSDADVDALVAAVAVAAPE